MCKLLRKVVFSIARGVVRRHSSPRLAGSGQALSRALIANMRGYLATTLISAVADLFVSAVLVATRWYVPGVLGAV